MHKDQSEHDASNCAYPPPPQQQQQQPPSIQAPPMGAGFFGTRFDAPERSFRSEELLRMMQRPSASGGGGFPPMMFDHSALLRSSFESVNQRQAAARADMTNLRTSPTRRPAPPTMRPKQSGQKLKPTDRGRANNNKDSGVLTKRNDLRSKNWNVTSSVSKPNSNNTGRKAAAKASTSKQNVAENRRSSEDLDRLLAVQLSNGLGLATNDFNDVDLSMLDAMQATAGQTDTIQVPDSSVVHQSDVHADDQFQIGHFADPAPAQEGRTVTFYFGNIS